MIDLLPVGMVAEWFMPDVLRVLGQWGVGIGVMSVPGDGEGGLGDGGGGRGGGMVRVFARREDMVLVGVAIRAVMGGVLRAHRDCGLLADYVN